MLRLLTRSLRKKVSKYYATLCAEELCCKERQKTQSAKRRRRILRRKEIRAWQDAGRPAHTKHAPHVIG